MSACIYPGHKPPDRTGFGRTASPTTFTRENPGFPRVIGHSRPLSLSLSTYGFGLLPTRASASNVSRNTEIKLYDEMDRWKWVCPRGHRSWEPTNNHFWCAECARAHEVDGVFHELRNRKTGELVERENLTLVTPAGPFHDPRPEGSA